MTTVLADLGLKLREKNGTNSFSAELRLDNGDIIGNCTTMVRLSDGEQVRSMHVTIYERKILSTNQLEYLHHWEARMRAFELPCL